MSSSTHSSASASPRSRVIEAAQRQLIAQQADLRQTIADRQAQAAWPRPDGSDGHGETEHLTIAEQSENDARLEAINRATLADVEDALARIDAATYGRCADCGADIAEERLEILPATRVCVACQTQHEHA